MKPDNISDADYENLKWTQRSLFFDKLVHQWTEDDMIHMDNVSDAIDELIERLIDMKLNNNKEYVDTMQLEPLDTIIRPFWLWLVKEAKIDVINAESAIEVHGFVEKGDPNIVPVMSFTELLNLYIHKTKKQPEKDFQWVCNECDFANLTSSVSEQEIDLELHACVNCGCVEMHKRYI
jgi:hypothetical protein